VIDSTGFPGSSGGLGIGGIVGSPYRSGVGAGLVLKGTIYDFGRTQNRVALANAREKGTKIDSEVSVLNIKKEAILHLIQCSHWLSLAEKWKDLSASSSLVQREVRRFIKTGQQSVVDQFLVDSQVEEANTQLAEYEARVKVELEALNILMGTHDEIACPEIDHLVIDATPGSLEQAPFLRKAQLDSKYAQQQVDVFKSDYYPELLGLASLGEDEKSRLVNKQDYALAIGLRFPLFEGFRTTHEVHEAQANSNAQSEAVISSREFLKLGMLKFEGQIRTRSIRLDHLKSEMELALHGFSTAKKRYFAFEGKLVDLRESLRNLSRVETLQIDTQSEIDQLKVELSSLTGNL
jgi:outer membrane protein